MKKQTDSLAYPILALTAFFLPMKIQLSLYGFIVFFVVVFYSALKSKKIPKSIFGFEALLVLLFSVFCVSAILSQDKVQAIKFLSRSVFLMLIPISFLLYCPKDEERTKVLGYIVWGCLAASIFCLIIALKNSLVFSTGGVSFDPRVLKEPQIDFKTSIVWGGNYFFYAELSTFMHPTYFSMFLILACCIILLSRNSILGSKTTQILLIAFFLLMIYLLSSRAAFLSVVALIFVVGIKPILSLHVYKRISIIIIVLGSLVTVFLINPKLKDLYFKLKTNGLTLQPDGRYSYETRLLTWNSAIQLIRKDPILGVGIGDIQNELREVYKINNYETPLQENYNVHNQFLETFAACGIFGLLALLLVLFLPLIKGGYKDIMLVSFVGIVFINFLFETMLVRYHGITFFTFFFCLLVGNSKDIATDEN